MPLHRHESPRSQKLRVVEALSLFTLLTVGAMVIPFWVALSAGIASVSIVVFGSESLLLLGAWIWIRPTRKIPFIIGVCAALFGLFTPQIAYYQTAHSTGTTLDFDPVTYLRFSGESMVPTKTITYKRLPGKQLQLALYDSAERGPRPLVVILHGGAWRYGNYTEIGNWPKLLTKHGYDVASVEYRLSNDTAHLWKETPADVHDALNFLHDHADTLGLNRDKFHLLGQSAGGHLALLEAYRHPTVQSVVSLYAPIDLELDYETSRDKSAELDFLGGPPAQFSERYRALSPLSYVNASSPRTLILQGKSDDLVDTKNAQRLATKLTEFGVDHRLITLPLTGHSFENQRGGFATQIAEQTVIRFLQ